MDQNSVLIYGTNNETDIKRLESQQRVLCSNCFKIKKRKTLKHVRDKHELCLVRELHVYELFKLMIKIISRCCGNKKPDDYINE